MRMGIRMGSIGAMRRELGLAGVANWAKKSGFEVLDVARLDDEVAAVLKDAGLSVGTFDVSSVGALMSNDQDRRAEAVATVQNEMEIAARNGGTVMFVCLIPEDGTMPRRESFAIWRESFPAIVKKAEELEIKIAMEPYPGSAPYFPTLGCTPEMWRAMFEAVDSPALGICFDPSHLVRLGIDYLRAFEEFGDRVHHVHLKDCEICEEGRYRYGYLGETFARRYSYGGGYWRYCIPGYGEVDWARLLFRLSEVKYEGALCIELEDQRYEGDAAAQKLGLLATKQHIEPLLR